jgi:hypothetical protein
VKQRIRKIKEKEVSFKKMKDKKVMKGARDD